MDAMTLVAAAAEVVIRATDGESGSRLLLLLLLLMLWRNCNSASLSQLLDYDNLVCSERKNTPSVSTN